MRQREMKSPDSDAMVFNEVVDNELNFVNTAKLMEITGRSYPDLKAVLSRLVRNEQLFPIEKGLYAVRNFRNPYVIANAMLPDGAIAYWSALNLHGLTEQIPNVVYLQSGKRKSDKKVFNVRYRFIQVKKEKICGITQMGYGNERFRITDIEKTLLDCFDLPQYAGGYEELIRAFFQAKINSRKLLDYGKQMGNLSVLKRLAFLSELFDMQGFNYFQNEVLKIRNQRYTLLDPMGSSEGAFNAKWRIRLNIDKDKLLEIVNKMY
jgi:predicted transcriptional regulator of viral defense system